jgi:hypothetical protein
MAKKFKSQQSYDKVMLTLFWNIEGAVLIHFTPKGPDLAASDFHMFGSMRKTLGRRRFSSDEEVIGTVQNWLNTHPKELTF